MATYRWQFLTISLGAICSSALSARGQARRLRTGARMNRRTVLAWVRTASAAVLPLCAWAQNSDAVRRIGIIMGARPDVPHPPPATGPSNPFWVGLAKSGYFEGKNLRIERRYGEYEHLPALARELERGFKLKSGERQSDVIGAAKWYRKACRKGNRTAKKRLGDLAPEERRTAGHAVNELRRRLEEAVAEARNRLSTQARAAQLEAERLDLTELRPEIRRGALHPVTQARDHLEDVFVGMGFTVAEGPEVESAWYNFEALNIPEWHPARGSFDTIFVDLGEPEQVMLRSHTSPVQIRTMENTEPPIYIVAPGRTFRTDTADATHLPAFNQRT